MPDTGEQHAMAIRGAAQALRDAVAAAQNDGYEVEIPLALGHWLSTGTPPGELKYWTIKFRTF